MARQRGYDPIEAAKVVAPRTKTPSVTEPASQPAPAGTKAEAVLEQKRHEVEGTPIVYPEPERKVAPPVPTMPPPEPKEKYRVKERAIILGRNGSLTTLAEGSIVGPHTHDMDHLLAQKVKLEPVK